VFCATFVAIRDAEESKAKALIEKFNVKTDRRGCDPQWQPLCRGWHLTVVFAGSKSVLVTAALTVFVVGILC
jgi:hypothetical protein